jgi:glycylpeptide N-tetradecanoyltransferase
MDWHVGIRVTKTKKIVGFITGIPAEVVVNHSEKPIKMAEINFLCVHKKLRSKRLAPVLIKEITRRVNRRDQWQAVYTAGVNIPTPITSCRYWHRSLNPKKLIDVRFSRLPKNWTLKQTIKHYQVPEVRGQ